MNCSDETLKRTERISNSQRRRRTDDTEKQVKRPDGFALLWLEQRRLTARNGRFPSHGAHVSQSKRQYHDEHEPQKHQKRVVQEGGDRQGKKRTKRIKAVGTGCYVDMTRQTTWAIFSLFFIPPLPLSVHLTNPYHSLSTFSFICFLFF